jgi:hypothetical protein
MKQFFRNCFSVFFSRISLAVAVAIGLLGLSVIVFAVDYTGIAGSSGGTAYELSCGSGRALVGIKGKAGSFIDKVQGVCAQINYDGSWQGSTSVTGSAGGSEGTDYNLTCPSGYAISGIKGKAASYIDQLYVLCQALTSNGKINTYKSQIWKGPAGSTGGYSFGPLICTDNSIPARMIKGKAGIWVDSIGLGCDSVTTQRILELKTTGGRQINVGSTAGLEVKLTLIPAADVIVELTNSNSSVATVMNTVKLGNPFQREYLSVPTLAQGCATITASYKGSSDSEHLLVHSATSPYLSLTTPDQMGSTATITATIPSPAPAGGTNIKLTSLDKLSPLGKDAVSMPASIVIPQGAVSIGFQITALKKEGCVRIKASGNGGEVTHAIMVQ